MSEQIEPEPLPILVEGRLIGHVSPDKYDAVVIAGLFVPAPDFARAGRLYEEAARLALLAGEEGWDFESAVDGVERGIREFEVFPDGRIYIILQVDNP